MYAHQLKRSTISLAVLMALASQAQAQSAAGDAAAIQTMPAVTVNTSADASASGLPAPYAGGQVAGGGRLGMLGNVDQMNSPFSSTVYTQMLMQDQQARSVADVLQNDPTVRVARGFGNYQELYVIRGFPVNSDD
ncbi:MAG: Plug domain-containing protein, partial [Noviherbaspirillum sp.]